MAKARQLLTLTSRKKRSTTASIGESFDTLVDITEETVPRSETTYDTHKRPDEFVNCALPSFNKKSTGASILLIDDDDKCVTIATNTAPDTKNLSINLGISSLPTPTNNSNWLSTRSNKQNSSELSVQKNVVIDNLTCKTPSNYSHLKRAHCNPLKFERPQNCNKSSKRQSLRHSSDSDSDFEPSKKAKKQVQKSAKSFYASSIDIKSVKVPLLKVSKTKPESGSSQAPLLVSDEELVAEVQTEIPKRNIRAPYQLRSTPGLSTSNNWENIDISGNVSHVYFSCLDTTPLSIEFSSSGLNFKMVYCYESVGIMLKYTEIDIIEVNLSDSPLILIVHVQTSPFKRETSKLLSRFKIIRFWSYNDCYVALRLCERLDMITKDNLETLLHNNGKLKEIESSQAEEFLQHRQSLINKQKENSLKKDDFSNSKSYSTRSQHTVTSDKQSPCPPLIPILNFPSDTVVLKYCAKQHKTELSITGSDMQCLHDGEYLNDKIINFYLMYLWDNIGEKWEDVHIFNSFFYSQLTNGKKIDCNKLKTPERNHGRVKSWTKKVDIFKKTLTIVPVNYRQHWFLAVIISPNNYDPDTVPAPFPKPKSKRTSGRKNLKRSTRKEKQSKVEDMEVEAIAIEEDIIMESDHCVSHECDPSIADIRQNESDSNTALIKECKSNLVTAAIKESEFGSCAADIMAIDDITVASSSVSGECTLLESIALEADNEIFHHKKLPDNKNAVDTDVVDERQIMINEIMEDNEEVVSTNTPSKEDLLDSIFSSSKEEEFDTLKPGILVLDSMLIKRRGVGLHLKNYLTQEYYSKFELHKDFSRFPIICPKAPGQTNGYDCGVYLLVYAQCLLESFKSNHLPVDEEWAPYEIVSKLRKNIEELILSLSEINN